METWKIIGYCLFGFIVYVNIGISFAKKLVSKLPNVLRENKITLTAWFLFPLTCSVFLFNKNPHFDLRSKLDAPLLDAEGNSVYLGFMTFFWPIKIFIYLIAIFFLLFRFFISIIRLFWKLATFQFIRNKNWQINFNDFLFKLTNLIPVVKKRREKCQAKKVLS